MTDMADKIQRLEDIIQIQRAVLEAVAKAIAEGESFEYIDRNIYPRVQAAIKLSRLKQ